MITQPVRILLTAPALIANVHLAASAGAAIFDDQWGRVPITAVLAPLPFMALEYAVSGRLHPKLYVTMAVATAVSQSISTAAITTSVDTDEARRDREVAALSGVLATVLVAGAGRLFILK